MTQSSLALGSLIGQFRPLDTDINEIFTATLATEVTLIMATRVGAGSPTCSVYHSDINGVLTIDNAVIFNHAVTSNEPILFQANSEGSGIHINRGGVLSVSSSIAGEVTFSVYGVTETLAQRNR